MCGLCGVYGKVDFKGKQALFHLMLFSQLRGTDSTGVALIPNELAKEPTVHKALGGIESFAKAHPNVFNVKGKSAGGLDMLAILSHHRAATVGGVTIENAHPFKFENIIGTHNGTIPHHVHNRLKDIPGKFLATDSEKCLALIDTLKDPTEAFKQITGEYAFVWFDNRDDTICMVRNNARTLYTALTTDKKTMFYASEPWMLHIALNRSGVEWGDKEGKEVKKTVRTVIEERVTRIGLNDKDEVIIYSTDKIKPYSPPVYKAYTPPAVTSNNHKNSQVNNVGGKVNNLPANSNVLKMPEKAGSPANREEFVEDYAPTLHGEMVHKVRWNSLVKSGCDNCKTNITWDDRKEIRWLDSTTPICSKCAEKHHAKRMVN